MLLRSGIFRWALLHMSFRGDFNFTLILRCQFQEEFNRMDFLEVLARPRLELFVLLMLRQIELS